MGLEVVVGAAGDALELVPAPRELIFDVEAAVAVVGQLVGVVGAKAQVLGGDAEAAPPQHALLLPVFEVLLALAGRAEVLAFHLLELAGPEDEVLRGDLVTEALAHLGDAEGHLHAGALLHVHELHEHRLRGLGAQVHRAGGHRRLDAAAQLLVVGALGDRGADHTHDVADRVDRAERGAEHEIEAALLAEEGRAAITTYIPGRAGLGAEQGGAVAAQLGHQWQQFFVGRLRAALVGQRDRGLGALGQLGRLVGPEALAADLAVDQRVREVGEVSARLPDLRVHDDRRVDADHVLAAVDHEAPPLVHQVALELDAHRAVVVGRAQAAIDLRALEHEAPALAQGHDLLHQLGLTGLFGGHGGREE